ncbi:MAG: hypothetical protein HZA16_11505 [Nitrospirae bacterium]|nr:hypothetical protein [Nitrospirota bacterium]
MSKTQTNSVRFEKILLRDYGIFSGPNELSLDRNRTLIVGAAATGKTTIVNALAGLGPARGIRAHVNSANPDISVEVVTRGNRDLIKKHGNLIFLGCRSADAFMRDPEIIFADILDRQNREAVRAEARTIFQRMLILTPWKNEHKDMNHSIMSAGERVCLFYAFAFAIRKVLDLDLPAVFDSPYGLLDSGLRQGVRAFLKEQSCQQILLGIESEFEEDESLHYILEYTGGCSRIRDTH